MTEAEVLHAPFDIETHKKTFVNYLEVVILPDGTVEYAVPSHQEKLIRICMEKMGVSRQEVNQMCPPEYYFDFMTWLCLISECVAVWNEGIVGRCNLKQAKSLGELRKHGLYKG